MLSYAAHLPHSPILVPAIGPARSRVLKRVRGAIAEIASDLYSRNIEAIITLTPHGEGDGTHYLMQFAPRFEVGFGAFGDFATRAEALGEPRIASLIQHSLASEYPLQTATWVHMDSASGLAALHLDHPKKRYRFLPISYRLAPVSELASFGAGLRNVVEAASANIAVISLGDLARGKSANERAARAYDETFINHITQHEKNTLADYNATEADALRVCGFRPLAILLGLLSGMRTQPQVLSYERAHGLGMMVARFGF